MTALIIERLMKYILFLMAYRGESGESFNFDASCKYMVVQALYRWFNLPLYLFSVGCKYPGCTRARYREPYGFIHEFCGKTHATAWLMSDKKLSGYQAGCK